MEATSSRNIASDAIRDYPKQFSRAQGYKFRFSLMYRRSIAPSVENLVRLADASIQPSAQSRYLRLRSGFLNAVSVLYYYKSETSRFPPDSNALIRIERDCTWARMQRLDACDPADIASQSSSPLARTSAGSIRPSYKYKL